MSRDLEVLATGCADLIDAVLYKWPAGCLFWASNLKFSC